MLLGAENRTAPPQRTQSKELRVIYGVTFTRQSTGNPDRKAEAQSVYREAMVFWMQDHIIIQKAMLERH